MRKNIQQKGFTLIELLVVIAIIGILAGVVLASLGNARAKANDTKAQGQLSAMRAQAELFYSNNSNYGTGTATTDCSAGTLFTTAATSSGLLGLLVLPSGYTKRCETNPTSGNATAWSVSASNAATFPSAGALAAGAIVWCVDSTGQSKTYQNGATYALPASAQCS